MTVGPFNYSLSAAAKDRKNEQLEAFNRENVERAKATAKKRSDRMKEYWSKRKAAEAESSGSRTELTQPRK